MASRVIAQRSDTKDGVLKIHRLYRITDAAHAIGISRWKLRQLINAGRIPLAVNTGFREARIYGADLKTYLDSVQPPAPPTPPAPQI